MRRWVVIVGLLVGVMMPRAKGAESAGAVALVKRPDLRPQMSAFPRVVPNAAVTAAVAAKINASLARFEKEVLADARSCRKERAGQEMDDDWTRTVAVTMRGPRYLSLTAEDTYSCGAPHPLDDRLALVYDVTTGSPVNWSRLLPPAAKGETLRSPGMLAVGLVEWPLLLKKEQEAANEDCQHLFAPDQEMNFTLWLDGGSGSVMFAAVGLLHLDSAMCGDPLSLSAEEARKLGVAAEVVDALTAASGAR